MVVVNLVDSLFAVFFFGCLIFLTLFILTWIIFGRLLMLQIKRWLLASRGYIEVEHISATKIRNYFIMRPSENKFDIGDGFYHYIPECITRKGDIIKKFDKSFLSKVPEIDPSELEGLSDKEQEEFKKRNKAEWEELTGLYKIISKVKYDPQLLNRKFGMSVITYYGDNPDPVNPSDRHKSYGSGVIKDMYLRLLLTQRYKDFKMIMLVLLVSWVITAVSLFGLYKMNTNSQVMLQNCYIMLNTSNSQYFDLVNVTLSGQLQGSSVCLGGAC